MDYTWDVIGDFDLSRGNAFGCSSLWLGCSSNCNFGFLSRFNPMRSMNFQLEEEIIWSRMTLITFSVRQLHNLSEVTVDTSPLHQKTINDKTTIHNLSEEMLVLQSAFSG